MFGLNIIIVKVVYLVALVFFLLGSQDSVVQGRLLSTTTKPDPGDAAATARWLVSMNFWAVLNTISTDLGGAPFGLNRLIKSPRKLNLLEKHSEMKGWPEDHNFQVFKLEIEKIFLIDWFGGPKPLTVEEYLHPKMNNIDFIRRMLF